MPARTSVHAGVRCFVSIDLVGSTSFKMSKINDQWLNVVVNFLNDTVQSLTSDTSMPDSMRNYHTPMHLWRISGDEALFYTERLVSEKQVNYIFQSLYRSVRFIDQKYLETYGLGAKATMWLAGFPNRNKEFLVSSQAPYIRFIASPFDSFSDLFLDSPFQRTDERLDFLGPEIDLGFRLCSLASPGRVLVSFDTANFIAKASYMYDAPVKFYHVGWQSLKGLYGELPYPLFWLESLNENESPKPRRSFEEATSPLAARLFDPDARRTGDQVVRLYVDYCKDSQTRLIPMYIDDQDMPSSHDDRWKEAQKSRGTK